MTDQPLQGLSLRIDPTWPYRHLWFSPLGETINLTYVDFGEGFQDNSQPTYADTDIIGRGELFKTFMGTSNKELNFSVEFRVQNTGNDALYREVIWPARWIEACKHGVFDDGASLMQAPPPVLVRIGSLLHLRTIVTQADIVWKEPFEPVTMLPHGAQMNLTFQVVRRKSPDLGYRLESIFSGTWR